DKRPPLSYYQESHIPSLPSNTLCPQPSHFHHVPRDLAYGNNLHDPTYESLFNTIYKSGNCKNTLESPFIATYHSANPTFGNDDYGVHNHNSSLDGSTPPPICNNRSSSLPSN